MSVSAFAEEERWIVAAVKGGAWKSSERDPSVRTALRQGDVVRSDERLETFQLNEVALAKDASGEDIVAVRGEFRVRQSPDKTAIDLRRGRALAVLDGLRGRGDFVVQTPVGTAAVRGTRFSVEAPAARMDVKTYRGEVVAEKTALGRRERAPGRVPVTRGQKIVWEEGVASDAVTRELTERDWQQYRESMKLIRAARRALKADGARWFEEAGQPSRAKQVPADPGSGAAAEADGRTIVF